MTDMENAYLWHDNSNGDDSSWKNAGSVSVLSIECWVLSVDGIMSERSWILYVAPEEDKRQIRKEYFVLGKHRTSYHPNMKYQSKYYFSFEIDKKSSRL